MHFRSFPFQRVFVAGHNGMVGAALCRVLETFPDVEVLTRSRADLDLTNQDAVTSFFHTESPDAVIFAAAKVGGILANNSYPVEFLSDNVKMAIASIQAAYEANVKRFLFLGSTCIYPRMAPQPIQEDSLLTSPLEVTNEAYALAKIVGLKLCQYYRQQYGAMFHSAMPTNLYGPGDNYHPDNSHVLPALLRRFHEAKEKNLPNVTIWGTGTPRREFLHVDDLAKGLIHLACIENPPDWVNVGTSVDVSILELAQQIAATIGYKGQITMDPSKPDGTPRKLTDTSLLKSLGWEPTIQLIDGLKATYEDFLNRNSAGMLRAV